eukprot:916281-Rhodomonas_salina.1
MTWHSRHGSTRVRLNLRLKAPVAMPERGFESKRNHRCEAARRSELTALTALEEEGGAWQAAVSMKVSRDNGGGEQGGGGGDKRVDSEVRLGKTGVEQK